MRFLRFFPRYFPVLLAGILMAGWAGCETINHQERDVLREHNVPPYLFQKMLYGDPLSLSDIIVLSQQGVPPGLITHYMYEAGTIYILRKADAEHLRASGVSEPVIAYMLSTAPAYGPGGPPPPYPGPYAYPYGPYPYGYYGAPVVFVGGVDFGHGGGWGHEGWGRGGRRH